MKSPTPCPRPPVRRVERAIARVTEHAFQRARQRLGWPPSATARMAQKALDCGVRHQETAGRLRRFLDAQYQLHGHGNNSRIYGQHLFIFEGPVLITILYLPNELRRAAQSARH